MSRSNVESRAFARIVWDHTGRLKGPDDYRQLEERGCSSRLCSENALVDSDFLQSSASEAAGVVEEFGTVVLRLEMVESYGSAAGTTPLDGLGFREGC